MSHASRVVGVIAHRWRPLVDPRNGDIESDESAPERRSLLALAGNLLAEVSLPKMAAALTILIVIPAVVLGLTPLVATIWFYAVSTRPDGNGIGGIAVVMALLALAWFGGRPLLRLAERSFWSLNALAIQPGYVAWREVLLHVVERILPPGASEVKRGRVRAAAAILAGLLIAAIGLVVLWFVWPHTHWVGTLNDLRMPHWVAVAALANAVVVAVAYLAGASLTWGIADATMPYTRELDAFRERGDFVRSWRVVHLSDIHVVGERYGFRLGSGRAGPRGNDRLRAILERLDELHRREPVDVIVVSGDLTDAGTSAEWAELLDTLERFPRIAPLMVSLPGNHDVNVVDRSNPARLDLPTSPKKRLRQLRTLSALAAMQGTRVRVVDHETDRVGDTVNDALEPEASDMIAFADRGSRRLSRSTDEAWVALFPMVQLPASEDGLGIVALNSNAESHFSFTNALGVLTAEQALALDSVMEEYPKACWIVALHHHIVEHPQLGHALAERIGTTLINGTWFTRRLQRFAERVVVMHGHRHIDWMGACGPLLIISAPSAVMKSPDAGDPYFYVHTVGVDSSGRVGLAKPERVVLSSSDLERGEPPE
jgi:3',5'-cyclic AMP phosphodiesterase CpdA